jgi:hypothetical protein
VYARALVRACACEEECDDQARVWEPGSRKFFFQFRRWVTDLRSIQYLTHILGNRLADHPKRQVVEVVAEGVLDLHCVCVCARACVCKGASIFTVCVCACARACA